MTADPPERTESPHREHRTPDWRASRGFCRIGQRRGQPSGGHSQQRRVPTERPRAALAFSEPRAGEGVREQN
eukprot:6719150-Pyramimonas_sp.AAC.1